MASHVMIGVAIPRGNMMSMCCVEGKVSSEMQRVRISVPGSSVPSRLTCSVSTGRSGKRVFANGRQCVDRSAGTSSKVEIRAAGALATPETGESSTKAREFEAFQAREGSSEVACDDEAWLKRSGWVDWRAIEIFANDGDITEENMERLVEALVHERGQSGEDYRRRAVLFGKIAEFFNEGRAYSVEQGKSGPSAEIAKAMQFIVDVVLAEEGRSASDYNCRAQLFGKSAEVFPFSKEVRSS